MFSRPKGISRWIVAFLLLSFCFPQSVCMSCLFSTLTTAHCDASSCDCEHSSECSDKCPSEETRHHPLSDESSCPYCAVKMLNFASAHLSDAPISTSLCSWISTQFTPFEKWSSTTRSMIPRPPATSLQPFHTRI